VQLLKLRYLQLRRDLSYWVPLIAALVFFVSKWVSEVSETYCLGLAGVSLFFLANVHLNRRDLNFLSKYFTRPVSDVFVNYNLLVLPITTGMLANGYWLIALGFQACSGLLAFLKIKTGGPKLVFIHKYIPAEHFEWIAGIRKNFFIIVPLFLIAIFLSPVKFFAVVCLFLFNSIFLSFYASFEPLVMLNPEGRSTEAFLKRKIFFLSKIILISNVPLLLTNCFFHPDIAWFNISFVVGFLLLASCTVYIKYENYRPNDELRFQIDSLFLYAAAVIPFLLPVTFYLNYTHKKKAFHNLSNYIDQ